MVRAVRFERTITSTQNWWINQTFPRPHIFLEEGVGFKPTKDTTNAFASFQDWCIQSLYQPSKFYLATAAGLEPAYVGVKVPCVYQLHHAALL